MRKRFRHDRTFHSPFETTEYHNKKREVEGSSWHIQSKSQRDMREDNINIEIEIEEDEDERITITRYRDADEKFISVELRIEMDRHEGLLRDLGMDSEKIKKEMERKYG